MEKKEQYIYKDGRYLKISGTGGGGSADIELVEELPEVGSEKKIYLIEHGQGPTPSPIISNLITSITYNELKTLRDSSQLIPGMSYRITDYNCTTTQEDTKSADHRFDIIVIADSENTLNENARAIQHENDTYFEDSYLAAWELKYSLDNSNLRFLWAVNEQRRVVKVWENEDEHFFHARYPEGDAEGKFAWAYIGTFASGDGADFNNIDWSDIDFSDLGYTNTEEIIPGETIFEYNDYSSPVIDYKDMSGKGIIYYMKDEWNNECPYDFKNIQFKRKLTDGQYDPDNGTDTWIYTFNAYNEDDSSIHDATLLNKLPIDDAGCCCKNNIIKEYNFTYSGSIDYTQVRLNNNVFLNLYSVNNYNYFECYYNTFGNDCRNNTFGDDCHDNTFGDGCHNNTFGDSCGNNTFGSSCGNIIFSDSCGNNIFSNYCSSNTFGSSCSSNTFGDSCSSNTFGNWCESNIFGNNCNSNTFGNHCISNTFSNDCSTNTFGYNFEYNTFGNGCYSNTFGNNCEYNTFGNLLYYNTFGNSCSSNAFGNNCWYNTLLGAGQSYAQYNIFENGVSYVELKASTEGGTYLQNITICQGVRGMENSFKVITETRDLNHQVTYRPTDSEDKNI